MFQQIFAIFRGSQVPYKLLKQCSVFGRTRIMTRPVWPLSFHYKWPHGTGHLRPPEDGKHLPKHVRSRIWNALIKSTTSLNIVGHFTTIIEDARSNYQEIKFDGRYWMHSTAPWNPRTTSWVLSAVMNFCQWPACRYVQTRGLPLTAKFLRYIYIYIYIYI
jgi:hypothetical protein